MVIDGESYGGLQIPGFIGQTFFTADFKSAGTPDGRQEYPVRRFDGFAIRRQKMSQPLYALEICNPQQSDLAHLLLGDYKSPGFIGRTFFTADFKSAGTPSGRQA